VATPGAESAVYDCLVVAVNSIRITRSKQGNLKYILYYIYTRPIRYAVKPLLPFVYLSLLAVYLSTEQLKSGKQKKLKSNKRTCSEVSVNSPGKTCNQSRQLRWKDLGHIGKQGSGEGESSRVHLQDLFRLTPVGIMKYARVFMCLSTRISPELYTSDLH